MAFPIECNSPYKNTGQACENTLVGYSGLWLVDQGFSFATATAAKTKATVIAATKAATPNRLYPIPAVEDVTPEDQENIMKDRPFLGGKFIRWGKKGFTLVLDVNWYVFKQLEALVNGKEWACYPIDDNGNIEGESSNGTLFEPINCLSVQILPLKTAAAGENVVCHLKVVLADTKGHMERMVVVAPTAYVPKAIEGLRSVSLELSGAWTATGGKVKVTYDENGLPVKWLLPADFTLVGETIVSADYDATDDTYQIVGVGFSTTTLNLKTPDLLSSTTEGIESTGSVAVTI